ncbi:heterokaryon incompatibility protein-domain-containing protein [Paraphoma chrysanthemicola]|uniref:Heterokaryon incompatibility protein-domain-containing protein n=1 Tax=Paraphoma chrysanthemicola TaxID=798071 RepID=A0A8K0RCL0_9PLEO|nr:heterokaryon incompatibility protein-domain-containing protein [Paraphoma chrysanthemicola]
MERDTRNTFREICGGEEKLVSQMLRIENKLVSKASSPDSLPLRFVKLRKNEATLADPREVHLELTPMGQYTTAACYIAVSYTWAQSQLLEETFAHVVPEYVLWTSDHVSRPLRCSPLVFHRALEVAKARLAEPLIWIDQECIEQDHPSDIEAHLQIMHEIYIRSDLTVALLSSLFTNQSWFDQAQAVVTTPPNQAELLASPGSFEPAFRLLKCILEDKWATRTWAYQEWFCAHNLCYLLPIAPHLACITQSNTSRALEAETPSFDLSIPDVYVYLIIKAYRALETRFANKKASTVPDGHRNNWGAIPTKERIAERSHSMDPLLKRFEASPRWLGQFPAKDYLLNAFTHMEACDNLVFADRLAILSNMFNFEMRLPCKDVNHSNYSFSTKKK